MTVGAATEVLSSLGEQMPEGVWPGTRYWYGAHDNELNKKFVANYKQKYRSEEQTSETQQITRTTYDVFGLHKNKTQTRCQSHNINHTFLTINLPAEAN